MTSKPCWRPDLLRRFVPMLYVFSKRVGSNQICVESNDLEIALSVRHSSLVQHQVDRTGGLLCKLIRDMAGPVEDSEISIVSDGMLRVLHLGRGTILIHDRERSEILGFVSRNVTVQELISTLIPALFDA